MSMDSPPYADEDGDYMIDESDGRTADEWTETTAVFEAPYSTRITQLSMLFFKPPISVIIGSVSIYPAPTTDAPQPLVANLSYSDSTSSLVWSTSLTYPPPVEEDFMEHLIPSDPQHVIIPSFVQYHLYRRKGVGEKEEYLGTTRETEFAIERDRLKGYEIVVKGVKGDGSEVEAVLSGSESIAGRTLEGDVLFVRADSPNGFMRRAVNSFARFVLGHKDLEKVSKKEEGRGDHRSIILGVTRSYEKEIHFPELHTKYPQFVQDVVKHSKLSDICKHVSKVFETHFPRIAARYKAAGSKSPLPSLFGLFPMLCINVPSSGGVDCNLHVDYKNPAGGICAVIPFGEFDSSTHYWLVLNELGVVVELPAGVVLLFPSALIQHGNYHIVSAPTTTEAQRGSGIPRGSIVLFGQANWVNFLELGATMSELKNAKVDTYDYGFGQLFRQ
ncbi:hypothetical protein JCM5353_001998 [Sporobolomyces roseus]